MVRDEIPEAFQKASRSLERDHAKLQGKPKR